MNRQERQPGSGWGISTAWANYRRLPIGVVRLAVNANGSGNAAVN